MRELKLTRIRKNPFKFTGPKTTRGKAASSRNAMKHGVLSIAPVVPGLETLEDWNDHRAGIVTSLVPTGYVESLLAERIALIAWRLRRVVRYEVEATVASAATAEIDMEDEERFGVGKPGYRGRHPEQVQAHFLILVELLKELPEMPADKKIDSARARDILFVFARGLPKDIDRGAISIPGIPSDAGGLDRAEVKRGLEIMDANHGEVWAKLDAGTEEYFKLINRTKIPFARILHNIMQAAKVRPIVIQSLFLKIRGQGPSREEIGVYCQRLREIGNINSAGHGIKLVQVYTIARKAMTMVDGVPAWEFVSALTDAEVDAIVERVRKEAGASAEGFYGG